MTVAEEIAWVLKVCDGILPDDGLGSFMRVRGGGANALRRALSDLVEQGYCLRPPDVNIEGGWAVSEERVAKLKKQLENKDA